MKIADDIILSACAGHGVCKEQVLNSAIRTAAVLAARDEAVRQLRDQNFSAKWIANFLKLSVHAVNCRLYPATRAAQKRAQAKHHERRKAAQISKGAAIFPQNLSPDPLPASGDA